MEYFQYPFDLPFRYKRDSKERYEILVSSQFRSGEGV
jgi:hypothetical protein